MEDKLELSGRQEQIELLCNDKVLPSAMTLASARAFVWKNGAEEMHLLYRLARRDADPHA